MKNNILFVTDLDGTLLNTDSKINKKSLEIINSLIEKNIKFTYATARSLESAKKVTEGLKLNLPVITNNGGFIVDINTEKMVYSSFFTDEESKYIEKILIENKIYPLSYSYTGDIEKVSWLVGFENYGMNHYINNRKDDPRLFPVKNIEELFFGNRFYYTCIGEEKDLEPVYEILKEDERFNVFLKQELYRTEYWLEIMPRQTTKANGVLKLKEILNVDKLIVFGDEINDIPMFEIADKSYAVENGVEELKKVATEIIGKNDEDSVAMFLKENYNM